LLVVGWIRKKRPHGFKFRHSGRQHLAIEPRYHGQHDEYRADGIGIDVRKRFEHDGKLDAVDARKRFGHHGGSFALSDRKHFRHHRVFFALDDIRQHIRFDDGIYAIDDLWNQLRHGSVIAAVDVRQRLRHGDGISVTDVRKWFGEHDSVQFGGQLERRTFGQPDLRHAVVEHELDGWIVERNGGHE
jgi:hypothetical protein